MQEINSLLNHLNHDYKKKYQANKVILSFAEFIEKVRQNPRQFIRNSAEYICDTFAHFGSYPSVSGQPTSLPRYEIFDFGSERSGPIIGGEETHTEILKNLKSFVHQGQTSKLILMHGPNGSAKSSTVEALGEAMARYSSLDEGAVYKFNWIFPADRTAQPKSGGDSGPIGFSTESEAGAEYQSYAHMDETKIASKIVSEFRENPIFLIPMPQREQWLREWLAEKEGVSDPADVELPRHILSQSLSKKNQEIFENVLNACGGSLRQVYKFIQVERFYYSKQYRIGISSIEPQMSIDAQEKQVTMDKNIASIPSFLQTINFYQAAGELVEANRGLLEFSDLLKRPVDTFKYLLSTIERATINLHSGTVNLDMVYVATTNEKHFDAFKTIPDFGSFKGRFELIAVPYLLRPSQEEKIYLQDVTSIGKFKPICPHALETLCRWAVLTRLKQPDPDIHEKEHQPLVAKLDPINKMLLYEGMALTPAFPAAEQSVLRSLRQKLLGESKGTVVYEGRFGASPREVRMILHRVSQNNAFETVTPMGILAELRELVKDRTVYEFLQFEPRGKYHDSVHFIDAVEADFAAVFEDEIVQAMTMVEDFAYHHLLRRYIDNIVAKIKREKIWDSVTSSFVDPSEAVIIEVEKILQVNSNQQEFREGLLRRLASYRLENPDSNIELGVVFNDLSLKIRDHFLTDKQEQIESVWKLMIKLEREETLTSEERRIAEDVYTELERRFGYDRASGFSCLKFLLNYRRRQQEKRSEDKAQS